MTDRLFKAIRKRIHASRGKKKRQTGGFTLIEVLVASLIASIVVVVLVDFIVDLLQTDRREYGRSETQREMQMALDYMVNDLREAAYIYNNQELNIARGTSNNIPRLRDYLPQFPSGVEPILAFWKPEAVKDQYNNQNIPNCSGFGGDQQAECNRLQIKRRTYTLVVYLHKRNDRGSEQEWKGISRIMRYQLRMYTDNGFPNLTKTPGYVEPIGNVTFSSWPGSLNGQSFVAPNVSRPDGINRPVLVDFVDYPTIARDDRVPTPADPRLECPNTHPAIPPNGISGFDNPSFVACVSAPTTTTTSGTSVASNQDVFIFLRGNPTGKAGIKVAPLIAVRTQAVARGVIDKSPD